MMKTVARFVTRNSGDDKDGLILGVRMNDSTLKPGTVYEIQELIGELMVVEVGPSGVKPTIPDYLGGLYHLPFCWGNCASTLLGWGKRIFMTEKECEEAAKNDNLPYEERSND
jgi:hypothetical protein